MRSLYFCSKKYGKFEVLIDDEDYDRVMQYKWYIATTSTGKFRARIASSNKEKYPSGLRSMHQIILNEKNIDHINQNPLDNRKENLRTCSTAQNLQNRGKNKSNTSGYKGVTFDKARNKWKAQIKVNKIHYNLGRFSSKEEAAIAYDNAALKYHADFASGNFI